jgi:hypothetical protein
MTQTAQLPIDDDDLTEVFFSQPPPAPTAPAIEGWEPRPMSSAQRKAMTATFAMLGFCVAVSVCFAAYAELAMVKPARIGAASLPRPPEPAVAAAPALTAEPTPAAVVEPAALPVAPVVPATIAIEPAAHTIAATVATKATAPALEHSTVARSPSRQPAARDESRAQHDDASTDGLTKRAYRELHAGHAAAASELATRAIRLGPQHASAYIALAGARNALGDHGGANAAFRECARYAEDKLVAACKTLAR